MGKLNICAAFKAWENLPAVLYVSLIQYNRSYDTTGQHCVLWLCPVVRLCYKFSYTSAHIYTHTSMCISTHTHMHVYMCIHPLFNIFYKHIISLYMKYMGK